MTVSAVANYEQLRRSFAGDGTTTAFAFPHRVLEDEEIVVSLVAADGTVTVKTLTTDYTVSGEGLDSGVTVTFVTAPAAGVTVLLRRSTALTQGVALQEGGAFRSIPNEEQYDRTVLALQDHRREIDRTMRRTEDISGDWDALGLRITDVDDPIDAGDAVNKAYGDQHYTAITGILAASTAQARAGTATGVYQNPALTRETAQYAPWVSRKEGRGIVGSYYGYDGTGDVSAALTLAIADMEDKRLSGGVEGEGPEGVFFPAKRTPYHFEDSAVYPDGAYVKICGAGSNNGSTEWDSNDKPPTTWTADERTIPIFGGSAFGSPKLNGFEIEDICIDGGHDPLSGTGGVFPYRPNIALVGGDTGTIFGAHQGINILANLANDHAKAVFRRMRIQNMVALPIWTNGFHNVVEDCITYKTRDMGMLNSRSTKHIGNQHWFGRDSAISITRTGRNCEVAGNYSFGQHGVVYRVAGVNAAQNDTPATAAQTATLTGADYSAGKLLTLTLNGGGTLDHNQANVDFVLSDGTFPAGNLAVVRIVTLLTNATATVLALSAVPAGLQGIACVTWSEYNFGTENAGIHHNTSEWSGDDGIFMVGGAKTGSIHDNILRGSGWHLDSEVFTAGRIGIGSQEMNVSDSSIFTVNDWIVMPARRGAAEISYIAQIDAIDSPTQISLLGYPAQQSRSGTIYRAEPTSTGFGITMTGDYVSAEYQVYIEGFNIYGNQIIDAVKGGIIMGSTTGGSIKRTRMRQNSVFNENPNAAGSAQIGIAIREHASMRQSDIVVDDNLISLGGVNAIGVDVSTIDTNSTSLPRMRNNNITVGGAVTNIEKVIERLGSTNITDKANPSHFVGTSTPNALSIIVADQFAAATTGTSTYDATTPGSENLTLPITYNSYSPGADFEQVAYFVWPSLASARKSYNFLRNSHSTRRLRIIYHIDKIRTPNKKDYYLQPGAAIIIRELIEAGASPATSDIVSAPAVLRARGTITVNSGGATTGVFAHGFPVTPDIADVQVDPTNSFAGAAAWHKTVDATNVTVTTAASPATNATFSVSVDLGT